MDFADRLAGNLTAEAQAYGYTLTVWGAGAMLVSAYGPPDVTSVFLYVSGALVGFGALAAVAFGGLFERRDSSPSSTLLAASTIHVAATLGNLAVSYAAVVAARGVELPASWTFFLVGVQATATYNLLLLLEEYVVRRARGMGAGGSGDDAG